MKSSTKDKPWWSIEYEINYSPNWNLSQSIKPKFSDDCYAVF